MGATNVLSTNNQAITNYDYSKVFKTSFKQVIVSYTNGSGAEVAIQPGMLFGRISATGKGAILASAAVDGSQFPLGIVPDEFYKVVANGATVNIVLGVTGMVDESKIIFDGTDDLDTVIDGRQLRDLIPASTEGISLESFNSLNAVDNQ